MSNCNATSIDIKEMIEHSSSGFSLVFGTDLFIAVMPDSPDNAVCIFDTGGLDQAQYNLQYPSFQVRVRNKEYNTGYNLMRDLKYYLHQARNGEVWNGTRYISIETRSDILYLGIDDKNLYNFTLNFQVIRTE